MCIRINSSDSEAASEDEDASLDGDCIIVSSDSDFLSDTEPTKQRYV